MLARPDHEHILGTALNALSTDSEWRLVLDALPVPIYTTDAHGFVTYWNRACIKFAGREPQLGRDRWCVSWKIFTTAGEPLPHDECPMSQAIRQRRAIRENIAIAERPDGTRVAFKPYPTPLFDDAGELSGAVNMLVDVTEEQSRVLHEQAERCRRLASSLYSRESTDVLRHMAEGFERSARDLRGYDDN